jgi:ABC-type polysaccharide/polyol phosphate export permease
MNPLIFMAVYTLVFSVYFRVETPNVPYPAFLLSGLLPWLWFSSSIQQGTSAIVEGGSFIGRTLFPSEILPTIPILANMINFLFSLPLLLILLTIFHVDVGWSLFALPLIMIPQLLLSLGLAIVLTSYHVFFRDLQYLANHMLTLLFFMVPIMYPANNIPQNLRSMVELNPLTILSQSYQKIFIYNKSPDWFHLLLLTLFSLGLCWIGTHIFYRRKDAFAEYL